MKKFYKIITLFAALSLVACSNANNNGAKSGESTPAAATWETDATYHWHASADGSKADRAKHSFEKVEAECKEPTCDTAGVKVEVCTICSYKKTTNIDALGHDFTGEETAEAEVSGCAPTKLVKCKKCDKVAVRWEALAFDKSLSTSDIEENTSGSNAGSVRFKTAQDQSKAGSKLVYKINIPAEASNVSLAMNAVLKYGDGAPAPVFDYVSGDEQQGYVQNEAGEWVLTTKRYQLKINDVVVPLGNDNYGGNITGVAGEPHWYDWPVSFNLTAGVNTVEILCLGGYRAYLYDLQFTGLPARA